LKTGSFSQCVYAIVCLQCSSEGHLPLVIYQIGNDRCMFVAKTWYQLGVIL